MSKDKEIFLWTQRCTNPQMSPTTTINRKVAWCFPVTFISQQITKNPKFKRLLIKIHTELLDRNMMQDNLFNSNIYVTIRHWAPARACVTVLCVLSFSLGSLLVGSCWPLSVGYIRLPGSLEAPLLWHQHGLHWDFLYFFHYLSRFQFSESTSLHFFN